MELSMKDKVAVITGGTSGIGKATAREFAAEGAKVAVCGRTKAKLERFLDEMTAEGYEIYCEQLDVSDPSSLQSFAANVADKFGRIDIWINNAGIDTPGLVPFREFTEEDWDSIVGVNLKGVFFGAQYAAKAMKQTGGVIINISSFASLMPTAGRSIYSATKAAVNNLTKTLASELACDGIRVISLIPGYIQTEMTAEGVKTRFNELVSAIPLKRLGTVDDLTKAIVFLASDAANYITGVNIEISGGKFCTQNPLWSWGNSGN